MSVAFGSKADMAYCNAHVRLWPKADIPSCTAHVRFWGKPDSAPMSASINRAFCGPGGNIS